MCTELKAKPLVWTSDVPGLSVTGAGSQVHRDKGGAFARRVRACQ